MVRIKVKFCVPISISVVKWAKLVAYLPLITDGPAVGLQRGDGFNAVAGLHLVHVPAPAVR